MSDIVQAGIIAAIYASATLVCNLVFPSISWGPIQIRLSEAVCVLALLHSSARFGLTLGCVIANMINIVISGTGTLGLFDVIFGSLATMIGACLCWKFRKKQKIALFSFVISNCFIVPAYLPILCQWTGFYTIPFTTISLDNYWIWMYLFGVISIFISETVVIYVLGLPLLKIISKATN